MSYLFVDGEGPPALGFSSCHRGVPNYDASAMTNENTRLLGSPPCYARKDASATTKQISPLASVTASLSGNDTTPASKARPKALFRDIDLGPKRGTPQSNTTDASVERCKKEIGSSPGFTGKSILLALFCLVIHFSIIVLQHEDWQLVCSIPTNRLHLLLLIVMVVSASLPFVIFCFGNNGTLDKMYENSLGHRARIHREEKATKALEEKNLKLQEETKELRKFVDVCKNGRGPFRHIKFIRYPVDKEGRPFHNQKPFENILVAHTQKGVQNGTELMDLAKREKERFWEWEVDEELGNEFETFIVIDPEKRQIYVPLAIFLDMPLRDIHSLHPGFLGILDIEIVLLPIPSRFF